MHSLWWQRLSDVFRHLHSFLCMCSDHLHFLENLSLTILNLPFDYALKRIGVLAIHDNFFRLKLLPLIQTRPCSAPPRPINSRHRSLWFRPDPALLHFAPIALDTGSCLLRPTRPLPYTLLLSFTVSEPFSDNPVLTTHIGSVEIKSVHFRSCHYPNKGKKDKQSIHRSWVQNQDQNKSWS